MKLNISLVKSLIIASSVALAACSSGGGGSDDDTVVAAGSSKGLFVDAEVEGLSYTTSSGVEGVTDENGTYSYTPGDTISFSVGGVDIGTVTAAPKCTPTDFGAAQLNIARFIQSLDADGDPTNGIDLGAASAALASTTISSDAFDGDDATFEANADIAAALTTTGDTLISAVDAQANLDNGTDDTFDAAELEGNTFVAIVPGENDLGIITFETGGQVVEVFIEDTTIGGGDGSAFTEDWAIDAEGVLVLTDPDNGEVVRVTRVGGSTRATSVNVLDDGETESIPVTLLIPQPVTAVGLGGNGTTITSKIYDVITPDGSPLEVVFNSNGTFTTDDGDSGTYVVVDGTVISVVDTGFPDETTSLLLLGDLPTEVGQVANILFVDTTDVGAAEDEYNEIGVGSLTLKSVTTP